MKKTLSVMLMFVMLMSLMIPAYAGSEAKVVDVVILAPVTEISPGECVELSTVIPKQGSSFTDGWSVAKGSGTVLNEESGNYISKAIFKAATPGIYTIEYDITMNAGKSNVVFSGKGSITIEVKEVIRPTIVGAAIGNTTIYDTVYYTDGSIWFYRVKGDTYIEWSDNTRVMLGAIFFKFGSKDKDIEVSVSVTSTLNYKVTVDRKMLGLESLE